MDTPASVDTNIPHRFWLLTIFRSLGMGNPLLIAGPGTFEHYLDGVPQVAILANYLHRHGWIEAVNKGHSGIARYRLSPKGRDFWREGESWWRRLSFWEQCKVRVMG